VCGYVMLLYVMMTRRSISRIEQQWKVWNSFTGDGVRQREVTFTAFLERWSGKNQIDYIVQPHISAHNQLT